MGSAIFPPGSVIFLPGDYRRGVIVSIPVTTRVGVVAHKGILADCLGPDKFPTVIHNAKAYGDQVVETTMTDYCRFGLGPVRSEGYPGQLPPEAVLERARSALARPWKLTHNCEHFVGWAHDVPATSPQLRQRLTKAALASAAGAGLFAAGVVVFRRRSHR